MKNLNKLALLSTVTVLLSFGPQAVNASCAGDIRLTVAKRLAEKNGLSSSLLEIKKFNEFNKDKETELSQSLKSLRPEVTGDNFPLPQPMLNFMRQLTSHPMHQTVKTFIENYFGKGGIEEWSRDLTQNLVAETYRSGKAELIEKLEVEGKFDEAIMTKVLENRILDYDFQTGTGNKFHVVTKGLSPQEFASILTQKMPFIDRAFSETSSHGPWIHLWHVDMMISAMRTNGLDPHKAVDFYEWMGKQETVTFQDGTTASSLSFWDPLFDSFSGNFTEPERMNPALMKYFTWRGM
jgi:hypothetical protein